jgi:membrane protein DedA with SNARE-associated domain
VSRGLAGPLLGVAVIYLMESGLPLPIPEDIFVLYLGYRTGMSPMLAVSALVLIVAATLGSVQLYLVARRVGPALAHGRLGRTLHLTEARIARVERWFARWGAPAIVFGRYMPGPSIPVTVVAGTFGVRAKVFVPSVAVSVGLWVAVELVIGAGLGPSAVHLVAGSAAVPAVIAGGSALVGAAILLAMLRFLINRGVIKTPRHREPGPRAAEQ